MINIETIFKKGVLISDRYRSRDILSKRHNFLRLDLNENIKELDKESYLKFINSLNPEVLSGYPDLSRIYKKLATFMGVMEENIVITNGSDMAIKCIFDACIEKSDHIILHDPCYLMYKIYAELFEIEISMVSVKEDWKPNVQQMLELVKPNTKMMVFESPNGWIGTKPEVSELEYVAKCLEQKNVLLVVDEAYLYVDNKPSDYMNLLTKCSNIILTRTMSKAFGLAGARVGALISNPKLIHELYKVRPLYEISSLSAHAAEWCIDNQELLESYQETIVNSKKFLFLELAKMGINYKDTFGNFIIIEFHKNTQDDLFSLLKENGILIGKGYALPMLQGWWRIAVGDIKHCQILIDKLRGLQAKFN